MNRIVLLPQERVYEPENLLENQTRQWIVDYGTHFGGSGVVDIKIHREDRRLVLRLNMLCGVRQVEGR